MEKYYLGKLAQAPQEQMTNHKTIRLIEVQFSRRPPTLGYMYLSQESSHQDQSAAPINQEYYDNEYQVIENQQQVLLLSGLNLSSDNTAKLAILKKIQMVELFSTNKLSLNTVVDFDVMGDSLLIEGGSSILNEQQLRQSICMLLTRDGRLLLISMIDCQLKYMLNCQTSATAEALGGDCFIECYLRATSDGDDYTQSVHVYVVTEGSYYCFSIKSISNFKQNPQQHSLLYQYSLSKSDNHTQRESWLKISRLTPISLGSPVVMLELNDHSIRIINRKGKVLYNGASLLETTSSSSNKQQLVLASSLADQQTIILTYSESKITAHSLLIDSDNQDDLEGKGNNNDDEDDETKVHLMRRALDPDQLLPREPSFELEKCWSLDLNDIDSIRSLDDQENERDSMRLNDQQINGCLCPLWSSNQLNESNWPKFLLITYKYYVLIYSFEQQTVLPFSVVYDRAFLGQQQQESILFTGDQQQTKGELTSASDWQESIDLRMKPKLIHNFKLIGAQPTDLLVNTLFLVCKISLLKAKQFSQLGLVICMSNSCELFAFKVTSSKIVTKKDNLYQQLLLDSIRGHSLLTEEIQRVQANNSSLSADISSLSSRTNHNIQQERHLLDNLDRMLQVSLRQQQQLSKQQSANNDGMFQLNLNWSNLIQIFRIVVVCSVNSYILNNLDERNNQIIKSVYLNNDDEAADLPLLLFQDADSNNQQEEQAERLDCEPIRSMALIDLHDKQDNVNISLPMYLIDGQIGEISVYFVLSAPKRMTRLLTTSIRPSSLMMSDESSDMIDPNSNTNNHHQRPSLPMSQQAQMSMKYYKKTIQIKPLVSYQYLKSTETPDTSKNFEQTLEINCSNGNQLIGDWLHECLHQPKASATSKKDQWHLYRSTFTHCHLEYKFKNQMDNLTLVSDDFIALETIKKHLLKRATDLSIRLEITNSIPSIDNLRHLIGRQKSTLDQTLRSGQMFENSSFSTKLANKEQQDILLEGLLNQVNLAELPLDSKSIVPVWLERSIRQDVESLSSVQYEPTKTTKAGQSLDPSNKNSIMREIVFGFIIDALVDYDNLHNTRTSNEMMIKMRESLHNLVGGQTLDLTENQLVDMILTEWTTVKRTITKN